MTGVQTCALPISLLAGHFLRRHCKIPISFRYAAVELLTGAIFAWAAYVQLYQGTLHPEWRRAAWFGIQAYLASTLIVCTFIDLEFTILPDEITLSGIVLGLIAGAAVPFIYDLEVSGRDPLIHGYFFPALSQALRPHAAGLVMAATGALAGGGLIWLIGVFGKLLFRKEIGRASCRERVSLNV